MYTSLTIVERWRQFEENKPLFQVGAIETSGKWEAYESFPSEFKRALSAYLGKVDSIFFNQHLLSELVCGLCTILKKHPAKTNGKEEAVQLIKALHAFTNQFLPKIGLCALRELKFRKGQTSCYSQGRGEIFMAYDMPRLSDDDLIGFIGTFCHELCHLEQDVLVISSIADSIIGSHLRPSARQENEIQTTFRHFIDAKLEENHLKSVLKIRNGKLLNIDQFAKAARLIQSSSEGNSMQGQFAKFCAHQDKCVEILDLLRDENKSAIDVKETIDAWRKTEPPSVEAVFGFEYPHKDDTISCAEQKEQLRKIVDRRLAHHNEKLIFRYGKYLRYHELEAAFVSQEAKIAARRWLLKETFGRDADPENVSRLCRLIAIRILKDRYIQKGDWEKADKLSKVTIDCAETVFNQAQAKGNAARWPKHLRMAECLLELAIRFEHSDKLDEAMICNQEAMSIADKLASEDKFSWLHTASLARHNLARIAERLERFADAEQAHRESLALYTKYGEPDNRNIVAILNRLGGVKESQKQYIEAERFYFDSLSKLQKLGTDDDPDVAKIKESLARVRKKFKNKNTINK